MTPSNTIRSTLSFVAVMIGGQHLVVQASRADELGVDVKAYENAVQKGIEYLRTAQAADGSYSSAGVGPGVTAIVISSVLRNGRGVDDPIVAKGLKYMESTIQPDGSWVNESTRWLEGDPNLVTGYALLTLSYCRPPSK